MFIRVCAWMCVQVCVSGSWRLTSGVSISHSPSHFSETESLTKPGAHQLVNMAGQQSPGILLSLSPQCWYNRLMLLYLAFT